MLPAGPNGEKNAGATKAPAMRVQRNEIVLPTLPRGRRRQNRARGFSWLAQAESLP
jgi:hypothetical protein